MQTKDFIKGQIFSPAFDLQKQYATYHGILKNAVEGKVVTRFPPEPSGYLHIGHCKAALLNYHYAKMYKGYMILRFDDTNPTKQKDEYVQSILEDVKTLGITWEKLTHTSDYFDYLLDKLKELITKNLAYCDNTPVQEMREQRTKKIESKYRNTTVEQNLKLFELVKSGQADDYCIRAKIDMQNNNGCLRDPVLARVSRIPHHRTGSKYLLYPTYDFACPLIDSYEGVTHVLRTNEYADRIPQYQWVLKAFDMPQLQIYEYSRLNLQHTVLSKRKLTWFVDSGKVEGWNDPRFPTLRGCLRKGIRVETLVEFMLEQGPSKRANLMQWEKIWAINKRIIDPICPRYSAVSLNKASKIIVINGPQEPQAITVLNNKLNPQLGERPLWKSNELLIEFDDADQLIVVGEKITLMNWGNFQILTKQLKEDGSYLITAQYLPEDKDFKKTKKITWLANNSNLLIADLYEFDHLIKTPKVEQNDKFEDLVNNNSVFISKIYTDSHVRTLNADQFLQFERRCYARIDKVSLEGGDLKVNLFFVPDGKKVGLATIKTEIDKKGEIKKKDLAQKVEDKKNKESKKEKEKKKKEGGQQKTEVPQEQKTEAVQVQKTEVTQEQKTEAVQEQNKEAPIQQQNIQE